MKYTRLGNTGLDVSRICLGCMSYGNESPGVQDWALPEEEARPFIEQALEAGINFFDTANAYSLGSSEEIVGKALDEMANRDEIVIATKVYFPMRGRARNSIGLSRKAIMQEVDHSLRRLGTDYIDLYQIHRWDDRTPIEETMGALHDVVASGKVRYVGASSMYAWQFSKALYTSEMRGWTKFVSMQNHYNLLQREEEREMMPLCEDQGIGVVPWSPMARGLLTRDWDETTTRSDSDPNLTRRYGGDESDRTIVQKVAEIADNRGISRAQVALAWMLSKPYVTSPIIGATKMHHLTDAVAAVDVTLDDDEIAALEQPYVPRGPSF
ncbi:MAG: aldo/keto reductase [Actinomycetota bacterium]